MARKAAARQARLAAEAAERRRAERKRSLVRLAAVSALALAVVIGAVMASDAGENRRDTSASAVSATLFDGVPQKGIALGSPHARFVLTEFADLQCPFCATYARDVLPTVVDRYVRTGRLRLELNVLTFLGQDSVRAGAMAAAAARQDRLWPFADAFYASQGQENSGYATDDFLRRIGASAGLDVDRALSDRRRPGVLATLDEAGEAARTLGADHTPAFYLRRGDAVARPVEPSALTAEAFTAALDDALAAR